jgi:hypothetical protein
MEIRLKNKRVRKDIKILRCQDFKTLFNLRVGRSMFHVPCSMLPIQKNLLRQGVDHALHMIHKCLDA